MAARPLEIEKSDNYIRRILQVDSTGPSPPGEGHKN
ncbi:uncharacterized protein G2W53_032002 [Senna tora]|uniref:Uncharacterized protein n=1 Tax=Senna tora TaxID=362788 RepID=A0A834W9X3_9FABA|nr:uncharacterized protein G2W53_032002 [Senna tora]